MADQVTQDAVTLTIDEAERLRDLVADMHCWACGFIAARPDTEIPGAYQLSDQITLLRQRIALAQGKPHSDRELPF